MNQGLSTYHFISNRFSWNNCLKDKSLQIQSIQNVLFKQFIVLNVNIVFQHVNISSYEVIKFAAYIWIGLSLIKGEYDEGHYDYLLFK